MATCSIEDGRKPSERLNDLLDGVTPIEDADPVTLSWAEFVIHKKAEALVATEDVDKIKEALQGAPEHLEPFLRREVRRMWIEKTGHGRASE